MSPALEQNIAKVLEDWILELSERDGEIDLLQEQFQTMKKVIHVITESAELLN